MEIDVISEDENPMLHRTDVRFEVTHEEASPSRLSVRDSLAATLNKDADEVVIHNLDTKYGMRRCTTTRRSPPRSNRSTCSTATKSKTRRKRRRRLRHNGPPRVL